LPKISFSLEESKRIVWHEPCKFVVTYLEILMSLCRQMTNKLCFGLSTGLEIRLKHFARNHVIALIFVITGCLAGTPAVHKQSDTGQGSSGSGAVSIGGPPAEPIPATSEEEIIFSPVPRKFDALEELHRGPIAVQVRMAQAAELQDFGRISDAEAMTLLFGSLILVGGGFGAAALPLLGAYAAWGTIFFGGAAPGMSAVEQSRQSSIVEAIAKVDFPRIAQTALERRLGAIAAGSEAAETIPDMERHVEVVVLNYGFAWDSAARDTACSFLHAEIRLTIPNHEMQKDWVYVEPSRRSDDAPPAYCSYAKKLFADDSALARQTLSESAEILAAIVARRLEGTP
jgi:hypothetical protein